MKPLKYIWYAFMPSAFIAGLFTGRREFFLLFFIMLFCALYALALNIWTAFSFSYIQELSSASSVKGSALELKIGIYNDKPFPFTLMKIITETVVPDKNYELRFNLPPQSSINFTVPVTCPYRGIYEVGMTKLEINDIFGLICTRLDMRSLSYYRKRTVKVYPRLVELEYLPSRTADAKFSGKSALRVSEDGDSYSGLRRYRPGDKLVRVHKPVSARMRELYVKSYDVPLETSVLIAVDTAADIGTGEPARYLADTACECAAAIAAVCLRSGFSVEMAGADISRPFIRGQKTNSFPAIREALAVLPFDGKGDFGAALSLAASKAGGFRAAYVISAAPPDDFSGALMRLRREGCRVLFLRTAHTKDREGGSAVPGVSCVGVTPGEDIRLLQPSAGFRF